MILIEGILVFYQILPVFYIFFCAAKPPPRIYAGGAPFCAGGVLQWADGYFGKFGGFGVALTPSGMAPLGFSAPDFDLPDAAGGRRVSLADMRRAGPKGFLAMFICNHCPFVVHIQEGLARFGEDYGGGGLAVAAVSANDAEKYPEDAPDKMKERAAELGYVFPYLFDGTQETARAYGAACTPDFFLFDGGMRCVYRGQFDGSRPGNGEPVTGADLRRAADLLLAGKPVPAEGQKPSIGCSIKWKE